MGKPVRIDLKSQTNWIFNSITVRTSDRASRRVFARFAPWRTAVATQLYQCWQMIDNWLSSIGWTDHKTDRPTICNARNFLYFLGLFAKLRRANISFVMSLCPSVRPRGTTRLPLDGYSCNLVLDQYSETNVMHFLFSLLRIKGLYIFRALLAHPQEALHKRHLVYCGRVTSVDCYQDWSGADVGDTSFTPTLVAANWHNTHAIYQVSFVQRPLKMSK
jgi:hypothetical protein